MDISKIKFDENGLVPAVVQDVKTNAVLMLAYMNEESIRKTEQTGMMTYYSRSRGQLWQKGETSGHVQTVHELRLDCDGDTILALVSQTGPRVPHRCLFMLFQPAARQTRVFRRLRHHRRAVFGDRRPENKPQRGVIHQLPV